MVGAFFIRKTITEMKTIRLITLLITATLLCGCSSDGDGEQSPNILQGLIGTWGGNNTVSATGNDRTLIVTFNPDYTGDLTYESRSYYRYAAFRYTVNGNTINCQGVMAGEDGNVNENWSQAFEYHENYLKPLGAYSDITLYKEGYDPYDDDYMSSSDKNYENMLVNTTWYNSNANDSSVSFYSGHSLSFVIVTSKGEIYSANGEWSVSDGQLRMSVNGDISIMSMVNVAFPLISATIVKLTDSELQLKDSVGNIRKYTKK